MASFQAEEESLVVRLLIETLDVVYASIAALTGAMHHHSDCWVLPAKLDVQIAM